MKKVNGDPDEIDIEKIRAQGLDAGSVMRCSKILRALFNDNLSEKLVTEIQAWLAKNYQRPEVEYVLESIFYETLPDEEEIPCISTRMPMLN